MFKKLLVFKLWNKLFKITSCHLELSRRVSKIRVQLKLRKQNNKNPRRSFDSASSAQDDKRRTEKGKISPLQKSKIFFSRNDKQGDNHSPSTCHLERSREIQPSANTKKRLRKQASIFPKKNSLANFYCSLPHAVADGVQWVGGLGKGIRGLCSP